ncbi:MAG: FecR family protein [Bacteroides sp.]
MEENIELKILQYIKGELNATDSYSLESWMETSAENKKLVMQIAKIYYANQTQKNIQKRQESVQQSFQKLNKRIERNKVVCLFRWLGQVAATLAGVFLISYLLLQSDSIRNAFLKPQDIIVEANKGMQSNLVLPDGTRVWLNSGSKLAYSLPFNKKERRVRVEGLAYFEVEKDPNRAFVVDVNEMLHIHVLGTKFNVQSYKDEVETKIALTDGSILITDVAGTDIQCHMQVQDEFIYNRETKAYQLRSNPDISNQIAWIHNEFIFRDTPMVEVFKQLSHHFNVDIVIQDALIQNYKFTGKFKNKRLDHILDYIKATSPIRIQQEDIQSEQHAYLEQEKIYIYNN